MKAQGRVPHIAWVSGIASWKSACPGGSLSTYGSARQRVEQVFEVATGQ